MDVAGVISYFYRDSNKTPYADAYDYKNSYKSLNYTTSSDRLVALAKNIIKVELLMKILHMEAHFI